MSLGEARRACSTKGSIALEVPMATKRVLTTQYCSTERVQWNTCHNPYLSIRGWEEWEQKLADITGREFAMIRKDQQSKAR